MATLPGVLPVTVLLAVDSGDDGRDGQLGCGTQLRQGGRAVGGMEKAPRSAAPFGGKCGLRGPGRWLRRRRQHGQMARWPGRSWR